MEFKFRAIDEQSSMYRPPSSTSYFSDQALRAGYGGIQHGRAIEFPRSSCYGGREALEREIAKERMREEIIAAEITRMRLVEAEIRRGRVIEREMALRRVQGFSLVPRGAFSSSSVPFEPRRSILNPMEEWPALSSAVRLGYSAGREIGGFELLPFQRNAEPKISNFNPLSDVSNENVLSLSSKPEGSVCGVKRKTIGTGLFPEKIIQTIKLVRTTETTSPLQIKRNEEYYEIGYKERVLSKSDYFDKEETTQKRHKGVGDGKKQTKFWCEMCRIWVQTEKKMKAHKSGRKHVGNLRKLVNQNGGSGEHRFEEGGLR